eukprot:CAMPEP_0173387100 /NCGR_PEP_ID=MMETSP1356-20130122/9644_1 /TAXON_ID=77927 ORGANISM="Hemiselmis virescens, Strain PCC157" /NCGR_SAMPLE_ID=MMETSP1356 /ASSEMBLY_ACC=CAM_ASM_000847 /LENGTH=127 /DNA_ID=CAMNT_0014343583 /DNA_START=35 /DNA_END=419 /DNA_ORIENTATION=-
MSQLKFMWAPPTSASSYLSLTRRALSCGQGGRAGGTFVCAGPTGGGWAALWQDYSAQAVIVGGGSGVAFLGDLVHAGAANDWPCPHYRLHCYYMANGPGAEKRDNAASLLPVVVAGVYEGCVRMFRK